MKSLCPGYLNEQKLDAIDEPGCAQAGEAGTWHWLDRGLSRYIEMWQQGTHSSHERPNEAGHITEAIRKERA